MIVYLMLKNGRDKLCRAAWETIRDVYAKEVDGDVGMPAMICAVQTFGDLINYHPHIHTVAPEGVFTDSGYFVHIPYVCRLRAVEIWQEKVFGFLVEEGRIDRETVAMIRSWRHTGLTATIQVAALRVPIPSGCSPRIHALRVSVDNSIRIEAGDEAGMQRLIEYISRCPLFCLGKSGTPAGAETGIKCNNHIRRSAKWRYHLNIK